MKALAHQPLHRPCYRMQKGGGRHRFDSRMEV